MPDNVPTPEELKAVAEASQIEKTNNKIIAQSLEDPLASGPDFNPAVDTDTEFKNATKDPKMNKRFALVSRDMTLSNLNDIDKEKVEFVASFIHQLETTFAPFIQWMRDEDGRTRYDLPPLRAPPILLKSYHDIGILEAAGRGLHGAQWNFYNASDTDRRIFLSGSQPEDKSKLKDLIGNIGKGGRA